MKTWKRIVVHCSDSKSGSVTDIRKWHTEPSPIGNGWTDIGYHYVIDNGKIKSNLFLDAFDGSVEIGRLIDGDKFAQDNEIGAHSYGFNADSIGICLIGKEKFTPKQLGALFSLVSDLMVCFEILPENVIGHYEIDPKKSCPNINMKDFRSLLNLIQ